MDFFNSKNEEFAKILLQIYAGSNISEYKILNTYIYQYMIIPNKYKKIKNILKQLIKLKLEHVTKIGKIINKLGILPKYRVIECHNNKNIYFNCKNINYEGNISKIIDNNISDLIEIINTYKIYILNIENDKIVNQINKIIDDNKNIIQIFNDIKDKNYIN